MNNARGALLWLAAASMTAVGVAFAQGDDEATVRQLTQHYAEAYSARDADALVEVFAEDIVFIAPDGVRMEGRETLRAMFSAYFESDSPQLSIRDIETVAHGDIAYSLQTYAALDDDGVTIAEGFGLAIWRLVDGEWQWYRNVANVILPEPIVNGGQ